MAPNVPSGIPTRRAIAIATNPDKDEPSGSTDETIADLIARNSTAQAPKATKHSSIIILTSGTTGTPKGANRSTPPSLAPIGGVLSHVPFKAGEVTSLPAPMFHVKPDAPVEPQCRSDLAMFHVEHRRCLTDVGPPRQAVGAVHLSSACARRNLR